MDIVGYDREEQCRVREYLRIKRKERFIGTMLYIVLMTVAIGLLKAGCDRKRLIWEAGTGAVEIEGEVMNWVDSQFWDSFLDETFMVIMACNIGIGVIIWLAYYKIPSYKIYKHYKSWFLIVVGVLMLELLVTYFDKSLKMYMIMIKAIPILLCLRLFLPLDTRPQTRSDDNSWINNIQWLIDFVAKCIINNS